MESLADRFDDPGGADDDPEASRAQTLLVPGTRELDAPDLGDEAWATTAVPRRRASGCMSVISTGLEDTLPVPIVLTNRSGAESSSDPGLVGPGRPGPTF